MTKNPDPSYKRILEISPYVPGESASATDKKVIKLSSNENPFGCSENVKKAIAEEFSQLHRYPEGSSAMVREKLAQIFSLDKNRIVVGSGSDELITLICMAFAAGDDSEVLYSEHGFLMYPISALSVGAKPVKAKENDLRTDVDEIIKNVNENTKLIFIANPNNPTGSYITAGEIEKLLKSIPEEVLLVLDCAYQEYAEAFGDYPDATEFVAKYPNVIMLRTFSKAYGIPSLRLGWSYSSSYVADILNRVRGPFNVNGVAQVAGVAALEDRTFIEKSVSYNTQCLSSLSEQFKSLGLKVYPSVANFILVDFSSEEEAIRVDKYLRENGITGRQMHAYSLPSCIRFTIGLEQENESLINCLKEVVNR